MAMLPLALRQLTLLHDPRLLSASASACTRLLHASCQSATGSTSARAAGAAITATEASTSEASTSSDATHATIASWMYKTVKQKGNVSTAEFMEAKSKSFIARLSFWEKFYYAAGLLGAASLVYTRVDWDGSKARAEEAKAQRAAALELKRLEALPAFLAGHSFASEEDSVQPFEGASPAEIQALAAKYKASKAETDKVGTWKLPVSTDDDPFDGMTPEEIDAYMAKKNGQ